VGGWDAKSAVAVNEDAKDKKEEHTRNAGSSTNSRINEFSSHLRREKIFSFPA
jgi:hypothetical protein